MLLFNNLDANGNIGLPSLRTTPLLHGVTFYDGGMSFSLCRLLTQELAVPVVFSGRQGFYSALFTLPKDSGYLVLDLKVLNAYVKCASFECNL